MKNKQEVKKPWGSFERFTLNEQSTVKILKINEGELTSLQSHQNRQEFWKVIKGNAIFTIGNDTHQAKEGEEFFIEKQTTHRLAGGTEDALILEISFGIFDENDITRIEDKYGRSGTSN